MKNLQQKIDYIFDYLYASSSIKNPETIAFEVSKLLHTGIYIEKRHGIIPAFECFRNFEINSIFNDSRIIDNVRKYYSEMNSIQKLFQNDDCILLSDSDIGIICHEFSDTVLSDGSIDVIGDSLEIFRNYSIKSLGGQFFTDPNVTKLAIEMLNYNPIEGEVICDICAGTGGFLLAAINKIKRELSNKSLEAEFERIVATQVKGKEIDETVRDSANRNIQSCTGLLNNVVDLADSLVIGEDENNSYDCLATNPPFGSKITISDMRILDKYELSHKNFSRLSTPTPPDILFLEKNIALLKPGIGRLAIVLPYQILSGPKTSYIRKWLLERCDILAVIDLPSETFQPHTGTKTCLLLLKKKKTMEKNLTKNHYSVFFAKPRWVGHDRRGNTVYKKNPDGTDSKEVLCDFDEVANDWRNYNHKKPLKNSICNAESIERIIGDESLRLNALMYIDNDDNHSALNGIPLSNLVSKIFYPGRFRRNYVEKELDSIPFLGGSNITEHVVTTKKFISKYDPHLDQLLVKEGWLLITRSGTTGIVSIVPKRWDGYAISEHVIRIVPDESKEDPFFLFAFLQSDWAKKQLSKQVFGSVIDEISPEAVGNLIVPTIPDDIKTEISKNMKAFKNLKDESIEHYDKAISLLQNEI